MSMSKAPSSMMGMNSVPSRGIRQQRPGQQDQGSRDDGTALRLQRPAQDRQVGLLGALDEEALLFRHAA